MSNETEFFTQINSETDMFENLSKYITPNELNQFFKKQKNLNFFHLNISWLPYHFTERHSFLASTDVIFDVIQITESRLNRNKKHLATIDLPNYSTDHCPADGASGGALLYIKEDLIYKSRINLKIYKRRELEPPFIEIIKPKLKNVIVGCIYRHPYMKLQEFNNDFMTYLSKKLLKEKNKQIILMGDFNADLLKYKNDADTADFLDQICASSLLPHMTLPTRVSLRSKTLKDNIFSTGITKPCTHLHPAPSTST